MNALNTVANEFIGSLFLVKYVYKFNNITLIDRKKVRGYQNIFYNFEFQKLKKKIKEKILKIVKSNFIANIKLFRKKTGWKPKYSLKNGIKQTMKNINYINWGKKNNAQ